MISAVDALSLPRAELSPSDAEAVDRWLVEIEGYIRENMGRVGCTMPIDPSRVNPTIASEIERTLRLRGWQAAFQKVVVQSALSPGKQVAGHQLALAPTDAAYEEADSRKMASTDN